MSASLVAEQEVGERFGGLGLSDTGRAEEDERTGRPFGVLETSPRPPDGLGHRSDRIMLANDPLVELALHVEELGGLLLCEPVHGDSRPLREHLCDFLLADDRRDLRWIGVELTLLLCAFEQKGALLIAELRSPLELLGTDRVLLLAAHLVDAGVDLSQLFREVLALEPHTAACLVDEIDRLVRQEAICDVPIRQVGCVDQRLIGELYLVVVLVALAQSLENLDRVGH